VVGCRVPQLRHDLAQSLRLYLGGLHKANPASEDDGTSKSPGRSVSLTAQAAR